MRIFTLRRPDPPAARPHEIEETVREHLYGGLRGLDVQPRARPDALSPTLVAARRVR
jgi:hypothetical protein